MLQPWLVDRVRAVSAAGPYRPPTETERARASAALAAVLAGSTPDLADLPIRVTREACTVLAADPATGWGTLLLPAGAELLVEVPHPGADRRTVRLGLELHQAIPTAALLIAGAHRDAAGGAADVAHRDDSLFHAFAQVIDLPEVQLHGFAAATAPETDAVVSPGAGSETGLHRAVTKSLAERGFRTRHHERLAGRTNVQGIAAAAAGRPFLHLELAPLLRLDRRDRVVDAVAAAWHEHRH